jgi:hypothetical protein
MKPEKKSVDELDRIYAQASNIFSQTSVEIAKLQYKFSPLVVLSVGLVCMELGTALTFNEWGKDVLAANPFEDIFDSDYLKEIIYGQRDFVGEYITAAGAAIALTSPLIAIAITNTRLALHSINVDPLTAAFNRIGNSLSDKFKTNNVKDVAEAIIAYREAIHDTKLGSEKAFEDAWSRAEGRLMKARGINPDVDSSEILNEITHQESTPTIYQYN